MRKLISVVLFTIMSSAISYAGDYSTNYNVVLNDENDTAIMRIICIGLGSRPIEDNPRATDPLNKDCTYFHIVLQNLSDKPITIEKRTMAVAYFNYEGEYRIKKDGTFSKDHDVLRNISVNWNKIILPNKEFHYNDFPLCRPDRPAKHNLMIVEFHLLWNDKKYYISVNLPFEMEETAA